MLPEIAARMMKEMRRISYMMWQEIPRVKMPDVLKHASMRWSCGAKVGATVLSRVTVIVTHKR